MKRDRYHIHSAALGVKNPNLIGKSNSKFGRGGKNAAVRGYSEAMQTYARLAEGSCEGNNTANCSTDYNDETRIKTQLFKLYDKSSRPVTDDTENVTVTIMMTLFHILDTVGTSTVCKATCVRCGENLLYVIPPFFC